MAALVAMVLANELDFVIERVSDRDVFLDHQSSLETIHLKES